MRTGSHEPEDPPSPKGDISFLDEEFVRTLERLQLQHPELQGKLTNEALEEWRDSRREIRPRRRKELDKEREQTPVKRRHPEGFCYFTAVRSDAQKRAGEELGFNPWLCDLQGWLQDNLSVWTGDKFSITYGVKRVKEMERPYIQMHIEPCATGMSVKELLFMQGGNVRVGMADREAPKAFTETTGASARAVIAPSATSVVHLPFTAVLNHKKRLAALSPRLNTAVTGLTRFFESVEIVGFNTAVSIAGGAEVACAFTINTAKREISTIEEAMSHPVCAMFSGNAQGQGVGEYTLPPDHSFGREVKAVSVGNADPVFHWLVISDNPAIVTVRGSISLKLRGNGVVSPVGLPTQ